MKTLIKAAADHPLAIKEKANFIVQHFINKSAELSNDTFKAKGMLVVSSRPLILVYKKLLEACIADLPSAQVRSHRKGQGSNVLTDFCYSNSMW